MIRCKTLHRVNKKEQKLVSHLFAINNLSRNLNIILILENAILIIFLSSCMLDFAY